MFSIDGLPAAMALAGSIRGVFDLDAVLAQGRQAGWAAAEALGFDAGAAVDVPGDPGADGVNHPWPIFPHPRGKDFVDFDEDLQVKDILGAVAEGYEKPVGADNRAVALFRKLPEGWRICRYVEAPLAPILYMRKLYENSVEADFG